MIEIDFGDEILDEVLLACKKDIKGYYTSIGEYKLEDFKIIVNTLHEITKIEIEILLNTFGKNYLAPVFLPFYFKHYNFNGNEVLNLDKFSKLGHLYLIEMKKLDVLFNDMSTPEIRELEDGGYFFSFESKLLMPNILEGFLEAFAQQFNANINIEFSIPVSGENKIIFLISEIKNKTENAS